MLMIQLFRRCRFTLHSRYSLFKAALFVLLLCQIACEAPRRIDKGILGQQHDGEHHQEEQDDLVRSSDEPAPEYQGVGGSSSSTVASTPVSVVRRQIL